MSCAVLSKQSAPICHNCTHAQSHAMRRFSRRARCSPLSLSLFVCVCVVTVTTRTYSSRASYKGTRSEQGSGLLFLISLSARSSAGFSLLCLRSSSASALFVSTSPLFRLFLYLVSFSRARKITNSFNS